MSTEQSDEDIAAREAADRAIVETEASQKTWWDRQLAGASSSLITVFGVLFGGIALIVGVLGLLLCQHPRARHNAQRLAVIGAIFQAIGLLLFLSTR